MSVTLRNGARRRMIEVLDVIFDRADFDGALKDGTPARQLENIARSNQNFLGELGDCVDVAGREGWLAQLFAIARENTKRQDLWDALTEIESSCAAMQFQSTPGDHWGRAAVRLVNRQEQEERLLEKLKLPPTPVHFFLLPGDEQAAHDSYMERFRYATLPWLLRQPAESIRDVTELVSAEWLHRPPRGGELPFIVSKLRHKLDPRLEEEKAQAFRRIERFRGKIVLVQHPIWEANWSEAMLPLVDEYVRFWSYGENPTAERPWFFIFLHLIFDQEEGPPAMMGELEKFEKQAHCPGCSVTLLPYLRKVRKQDVRSWLMEHLPGQKRIGAELMRRLFPEMRMEVDMAELEEVLLKLVEEEK